MSSQITAPRNSGAPQIVNKAHKSGSKSNYEARQILQKIQVASWQRAIPNPVSQFVFVPFPISIASRALCPGSKFFSWADRTYHSIPFSLLLSDIPLGDYRRFSNINK